MEVPASALELLVGQFFLPVPDAQTSICFNKYETCFKKDSFQNIGEVKLDTAVEKRINHNEFEAILKHVSPELSLPLRKFIKTKKMETPTIAAVVLVKNIELLLDCRNLEVSVPVLDPAIVNKYRKIGIRKRSLRVDFGAASKCKLAFKNNLKVSTSLKNVPAPPRSVSIDMKALANFKIHLNNISARP